jgi:hypothetical protein
MTQNKRRNLGHPHQPMIAEKNVSEECFSTNMTVNFASHATSGHINLTKENSSVHHVV